MTGITRLPKVHPSRSPLDRLAPESWTDITRTRGPTSAEYAVIETLSKSLALKVLLRAPLSLPPTLMQGAPGLGKTAFARRMAETLGFHLEIRSMAEMTAGFMLTGSSSTWSEAQPGLIARMLIGTPNGKAPLLVLDELDKARDQSSYPPHQVLLGMLESHTAEQFRDEYLDVALDIRPLSFLFTANEPQRIRPELLSRLQSAEIKVPTPDQMPAIVRSVDQVLRQENPDLRRAFLPLPAEVIEQLGTLSPRALRSALNKCYALVADRDYKRKGRLCLRKQDVLEVMAVKEPTVDSRLVRPKYRSMKELSMLMIDFETYLTVH